MWLNKSGHKINVATLNIQIFLSGEPGICQLLTKKGARCKKSPVCGIVQEKKISLFYKRIIPEPINHLIMKLLSECIRSFFEGFTSFYTSLFDEMKRW